MTYDSTIYNGYMPPPSTQITFDGICIRQFVQYSHIKRYWCGNLEDEYHYRLYIPNGCFNPNWYNGIHVPPWSLYRIHDIRERNVFDDDIEIRLSLKSKGRMYEV